MENNIYYMMSCRKLLTFDATYLIPFFQFYLILKKSSMYVCLHFFKNFYNYLLFCLDQSGYMTRHETQTTNRFLNESLTQSNGGHAMNGVIIFFPKKFFSFSPYI